MILPDNTKTPKSAATLNKLVHDCGKKGEYMRGNKRVLNMMPIFLASMFLLSGVGLLAGASTPEQEELTGSEGGASARAGSGFSDDFESYKTGTFPNTWTPDANANDASTNYVDGNAAYSGSKSLRLFGDIGASWASIVYHPCDTSSPFSVEATVRNGDEALSGAHPDRGTFGLRQGTSWTNPHRFLLYYRGSGTVVSGNGTNLGTYSTLTWYKWRIEYEKVSSSQVRIGYWLDGVHKLTETLASVESEDKLTNFELSSQEGSAWFDSIRVAPLASTNTISGYVRKSGSTQGISGATLSTNTGGYSARTDSSGHYNLNVINGTYTITVSAPGYSSTSTSVSVSGKDITRDFSLEYNGMAIRGRITTDNEVPLEGVMVELMKNGMPIDETYTDEGGDYSFLVDPAKVPDGADLKTRASLIYSPAHGKNNGLFYLYDEKQWGHKSEKDPSAIPQFVESSSWRQDSKSDKIVNIFIGFGNGGVVLSGLIQGHKYFESWGLAPNNKIEVEYNDDDGIIDSNPKVYTSYYDPNTKVPAIHIYNEHYRYPDITAHEYSHWIARINNWNLPYGPQTDDIWWKLTKDVFKVPFKESEALGENFANFGSVLIRNDPTFHCSIVSTIDIGNDQETNLNYRGNLAPPIGKGTWNYAMAGAWWDLADTDGSKKIDADERKNVGRILDTLKTSPKNYKQFYNIYKQLTPDSIQSDQQIKRIFENHGYEFDEWWDFILGSPGTIHVYDSLGRHIGCNLTNEGSEDMQILGGAYTGKNSEPQKITIECTDYFKIVILGSSNGTFDLKVVQHKSDGNITKSYSDIPITDRTEATVEIDPENPDYTMKVDANGDGTVESTYSPKTQTGVPTPPKPAAGAGGFIPMIDFGAALVTILLAIMVAGSRRFRP